MWNVALRNVGAIFYHIALMYGELVVAKISYFLYRLNPKQKSQRVTFQYRFLGCCAYVATCVIVFFFDANDIPRAIR